MKLLAVAHHLRNLCESANQISVMDDSSCQDFEVSCNRIESAVNMAGTLGFKARIWVDHFSDELKVVEVWNTETDEVIVMPVSKSDICYHDYRTRFDIWFSRISQ